MGWGHLELDLEGLDVSNGKEMLKEGTHSSGVEHPLGGEGHVLLAMAGMVDKTEALCQKRQPFCFESRLSPHITRRLEQVASLLTPPPPPTPHLRCKKFRVNQDLGRPVQVSAFQERGTDPGCNLASSTDSSSVRL